MVGVPQSLAVQVGPRADAVEQQPAGADPSAGGQGQHLVRAPSMLARAENLRDQPPEEPVQLQRGAAERLAARKGHCHRVHSELLGGDV